MGATFVKVACGHLVCFGHPPLHVVHHWLIPYSSYNGVSCSSLSSLVLPTNLYALQVKTWPTPTSTPCNLYLPSNIYLPMDVMSFESILRARMTSFTTACAIIMSSNTTKPGKSILSPPVSPHHFPAHPDSISYHPHYHYSALWQQLRSCPTKVLPFKVSTVSSFFSTGYIFLFSSNRYAVFNSHWTCRYGFWWTEHNRMD